MDAVATGRAAACRPSGAGPVGVYKPRTALPATVAGDSESEEHENRAALGRHGRL